MGNTLNCVSGNKIVRKSDQPARMTESVQIKIKSPSANYSDLELPFQLTETVLTVKEKIEENFPSKPPVSGQKLVYSGKILADKAALKDILRFDSEVTTYTFHLVCALPQKQKAEQSESPAPASELRQRHTAASISSYTSSAQLGDTDQMAEMMREFSTQYSAAMASMVNNPSEAEIAAMQQMYNQYVTLYMQYMQSQSLQQAQLFVPQDQQVGAGVDLQPQVAAEAAPAGNEGPNPGGPGGPGGLVMNAGAAAGQIQDVGDRQRDVLDWVYVMTRVMLLFSVIYFHSSFLRLAFVAGLGFLVYLYQNRRNGRGRARPQGQQHEPAPQHLAQQVQGGQENHQQLDGEQAGETAEEISEDNSDNESSDATVEEEPKPSKLAVIFTFFSTLVSSIIPEQPQVV